MAFVLVPGRPIPKAVTKAAEKQLRNIVEELTGESDLDPDEAAHDARKRTKKLRALLRLARPELGDKVYRRENAALRDAARLLSPVRDAWVLIEALDELVTSPDEILSPEAVAGFRAVLAAEHRELQTGQQEHGALAQAAGAYEQVLARVSRWPLKDHGWSSFDEGVEAVFRGGRQAMTLAQSKGRAEDFHEWRRQVKYLRHQFGLLRRVWPDVLEAMEDTADELGERLGAEHDLAVLRERVEAEPSLAPAVRRALLRRIDTAGRTIRTPRSSSAPGSTPRSPPRSGSVSGDCGTPPRERHNVVQSGGWATRKGHSPCPTRVLSQRSGKLFTRFAVEPAGAKPVVP